MSLRDKLHGYGDETMITFTINRWRDSGENWDTFYANYPYGRGIPPWNVKNILEHYETEQREQREQREREQRQEETHQLSLVLNRFRYSPTITNAAGEETRNPLRRRIDPNLTRHIASNFIRKPTDGGNRKSRRNRKSKKSRKGKTQKKRRKSRKGKTQQKRRNQS